MFASVTSIDKATASAHVSQFQRAGLQSLEAMLETFFESGGSTPIASPMTMKAAISAIGMMIRARGMRLKRMNFRVRDIWAQPFSAAMTI